MVKSKLYFSLQKDPLPCHFFIKSSWPHKFCPLPYSVVESFLSFGHLNPIQDELFLVVFFLAHAYRFIQKKRLDFETQLLHTIGGIDTNI